MNKKWLWWGIGIFLGLCVLDSRFAQRAFSGIQNLIALLVGLILGILQVLFTYVVQTFGSLVGPALTLVIIGIGIRVMIKGFK